MKWLIVLLLLTSRGDAKPTAPVTITLAQRWLGGADYEVTLTARPTRDTDVLELSLDGRTRRIERARAHVVQTLTVRVHVRGTGRRVVGGAAVRSAGRRRSVADDVLVGVEPPRAQLPSKILVMPDGTRVDEVRP
jgi:hypothetical protein